MSQIQFISVTPEELSDMIAEKVAKAISDVQEKSDLKKPILYTRQEVAELFDASLVTLDKWCKAGHLTKYRIGGKIRFKVDEVEKALEEVKNLKYKR